MPTSQDSSTLVELKNLGELLEDQSRRLARAKEIVAQMITLISEAKELGIPNLLGSVEKLATTLVTPQPQNASAPAPAPRRGRKRKATPNVSVRPTKGPKKDLESSTQRWTIFPMAGRFWENILNSDLTPSTDQEAFTQVYGDLSQVHVKSGTQSVTVSEDLARGDQSILRSSSKRASGYLVKIGTKEAPRNVEISPQLKRLAEITQISEKHKKLSQLINMWGWNR